MSNLYITHTPYHVLISCGLACFSREKMNYLIIIRDFPNVDAYYESILEWKNNPFTDIILIPGMYNIKNNNIVNVTRICYRNIHIIQSFYKYMSVGSRAFLFNDRRPEGQIMAYLISKRNGLNIYVEDGLDVYSDHVAKKTNLISKFFFKMIYGQWFDPVQVLGTCKYINEIMVFRPEFVRFELKNNKLTKIPNDIFKSIGDDFISILSKNYITNLDDLIFDCFLIIDHSDSFKNQNLENIMKVYSQLINFLLETFKNIGIKYHPREQKHDFLNLGINEKISLLPNSLSMEILLILFAKNPPKLIIGNFSTAILTCNMLLGKNTHLISIVNILCQEDNCVVDMFEKVGITVPSSMSELRHEICSISDNN
jgi:hypothetical protein